MTATSEPPFLAKVFSERAASIARPIHATSNSNSILSLGLDLNINLHQQIKMCEGPDYDPESTVNQCQMLHLPVQTESGLMP